MRSRRLIWILASLLLLAGAWFFWHPAGHRAAQKKIVTRPTVVTVRSTSTMPKIPGLTVAKSTVKAGVSSVSTNKFAYRLSNTGKSIGELEHDDRAILLENAFIDTSQPLNLAIPSNLKSKGDPGAYIVQARGPIDAAFRAMLSAAGATIVSYIPNDAYLVTIAAGSAAGLAGNPLTQALIPYEPYYKLPPSLLDAVLNNQPVTELKVAVFPNDAAATATALGNAGVDIVAEEPSPFGGETFTVQGVSDVAAVARMSEVQWVEAYRKRVIANDLARVTLGISTDTITPTNYMNLTGSNVIVEMNDSGVDAMHPDFSVTGSAESPGTVPPSRVIGDAPQSLVDTNGHGTHVAGIIAGNGSESFTINTGTNLPEGSVTNADFRGKAPNAMLYSVGGIEGDDTNLITDAYLQAQPALTNALISNNSWDNGDQGYDLEAASYDAAVRDALPFVTGSQPVLFVFAAGNDGNGNNDGSGGDADSVDSPGSAKDVVTVGALEELRNITNYVTALDGSSNQVWLPMTDTSYEVADYSSRGNVGIGTEGTYGRFKPDVVAPGTFVVSTRSEQWDQAAYYDPTNFSGQAYTEQTVAANAVNYYNLDLSTMPNVVGITIEVVPNDFTSGSLNLPVYISSTPSPDNFPDPTDPATYEVPVETNTITIPPDPNGGGAAYLAAAIASGGFNYAVGNSGTQPANYDLFVEITSTNDLGNYFTVLSNLNDTIGPWYRYETGTSMATPAVSGVLALMQDYFTNTLHALPSPALLKAMVINGARTTSFYNLQVQNSINYEGWGLANLPDSLPPGITNGATAFEEASASMFFFDQNPTNALATGDSQTFMVTVSSNALAQPLRVTLAWTDPPGNPAAAIKLVNNLTLVVTNLDDPANPIIYYGNDISSGNFNNPETTNTPPVLDAINNVQNVYLPAGVGTNFSVTVTGYRVNVNAVTAQTNNSAGVYEPNVVQDYALVISSGNGQVTNAITVTPSIPAFASNPTGDQQITFVPPGNITPLLNQIVGANSPLLGTNTITIPLANLTTVNALNGVTNEVITIGQTNQWHFYVVTNSLAVTNNAITNAAFITFDPETLSIPRMGVFADSQADATQPEADIDLYVSTDPTLTNLNPTAIYNAVTNGTVSLGRSGTEFVVYTNSQPGEVYYVGVKSETQEASEYAFLPVFSSTPFSTSANGIEYLTGYPLNAVIPGGNPAVPGSVDVVALAIYPINVLRVIVTNVFTAQNFGDLVGTLNHNDIPVILNNHDSTNSPIINQPFIYDDSGFNDIPNARPSDGPGSLNSFMGENGTGVWVLNEANNAEGFSNVVDSFSLAIEPDNNLFGNTNLVIVQPNSWVYGYVDAPPVATNLTVTVTNTTGTATPPLEMFIKYGALPTTNSFDEMVLITNVTSMPPEVQGSITNGPPLTSGFYYVGVYNPSSTAQTILISATLGLGTPPAQAIYTSSGPVPLLDDAVTTNNIAVTATNSILSVDVALRVDHPRVSDLVFHLISPEGTRVLLVENRGGATTNGMGANLPATTNTIAQAYSGGANASTNIINTGQTNGTLAIQYNFFTLPDEMAIYDMTNLPLTTNSLIFDSGFVSYGGTFNVPYTNAPLTIVMNPNGNPAGAGDLWQYTVEAIGPQYTYLVLTENTNLTTTPIKFAPTPFGSPSNDLFYLPEQPMDPLVGEDAYGQWTLEVQDDRAGATNPAPSLVSWQLRFNFTTTSGQPGTITNEIPLTNTIPAYSIAYYLVYVPTNAIFATNSLSLTNGPLNLWFNETTPPTGTNAGDFLLFSTSTNEFTVLSTTSTPTNIVPGGSYWLAVQNTNSFAVTNYALQVTFDLTTVTVTNPPIFISSITSTNIGGTNGFWLEWYAPTNDIFQVQWAASLPPVWNTFTNIIPYTGPITPTNGLFTFFDSSPGPLRFYRLKLLGSLVASPTNGVPETNTVPANSIAYYLINVPTNADFATNSLSLTNGPLNLWFNETTPPSGTGSPGDTLLFSTSTNEFTVLSTTSTPTNIVPGGSYYLAVQNTNSFAVTNYTLQVNFSLVPTSPVTNYPVSSIVFTNVNGTNGILLTWSAPTNYQFQIQWATSLVLPISWTTIPGVVPMLVAVSGTTGTYQYFDNGSMTGGFGLLKFYRLIAYSPFTTVPPELVVSSVQAFPGGGIEITWAGSTNYDYEILWTTNLALPTSNWLVLSNLIAPVLTYTGGEFTFNDSTGTQTGGAASMKFFQVVEY
jgi:subtilisin-like proprotein convertase family protein